MFARISNRRTASDRGEVDLFMAALIAFIGLIAAGLIALVVFAIVAAANTPSVGRIEAKHFTPAYTTTFCHLVGKVTVCTPQYHGDSWEFDLKNEDQHKEGWVTVSQGTYDAHSVGDWYDTKQG